METLTEEIPDKSKSLRSTSVKKRLETEVKRKMPKIKEKMVRKKRLSKYRRKNANAKERERMKNVNQVFETLREILPKETSRRKEEEEKETKVTTMRGAITYINCLQQLLQDCRAGRVEQELLRQCALREDSEHPGQGKTPARGSRRPTKEGRKRKKKVILHPKWINYSQHFLETKFCQKNVSGAVRGEVCVPCYPDTKLVSGAPSPPSPECLVSHPRGHTPPSPRDVNEICLHISLLDTACTNQTDTTMYEVTHRHTKTQTHSDT